MPATPVRLRRRRQLPHHLRRNRLRPLPRFPYRVGSDRPNRRLGSKKIALPEMFRIGGARTADLVLPDEAASRNHATIEVTGPAGILTDLAATNGATRETARSSPSDGIEGWRRDRLWHDRNVVNGPPPPAFDVQKTSVLPVMRRPAPQPEQQAAPRRPEASACSAEKP